MTKLRTTDDSIEMRVNIADKIAPTVDDMLMRIDGCPCPGVMRAGCPCSRCHGTGWYCETTEDGEDYRERYCDCEDGKKLREREK